MRGPADDANASAASGTLASQCARVLRETRDPDAATFACSAVLALVDASHQPQCDAKRRTFTLRRRRGRWERRGASTEYA